MNWEAIGAIGEVVGAAAVFISLLYLATQIRGSRQSDQIATSARAASNVNSWLSQLVVDEALHDLYRRGLTDYDSLTKQEKGRYSLLLFQLLRFAETAWLHKQMGIVDAGYWTGVEATLVFVFRTTGGGRFLAKNSHYFAVEFFAALQKMLAEADSAENMSHETDGLNP